MSGKGFGVFIYDTLYNLQYIKIFYRLFRNFGKHSKTLVNESLTKRRRGFWKAIPINMIPFRRTLRYLLLRYHYIKRNTYPKARNEMSVSELNEA